MSVCGLVLRSHTVDRDCNKIISVTVICVKVGSFTVRNVFLPLTIVRTRNTQYRTALTCNGCTNGTVAEYLMLLPS